MMTQITQRIGVGTHTAEQLAYALEMSPLGGATKRKIGALGAFGFIDRVASGYVTTSLGKRLLRPMPGETEQILKEAFMSVPIYQEVWSAYQGEGVLPTALGVVLERKFGISDGNGEFAAKVLRDSALYAGLINEVGVFTRPAEEPGPTVPGNPGPTLQQLAEHTAQSEGDNKPEAKMHSVASITLSNPRAELRVPEHLGGKDLRRVTRWLDEAVKPWLRLQVEEEELDEEANA
jgi:hypothetical protein